MAWVWQPIIIVISAVVAAAIVHEVFYFILRAVSKRTKSQLDDELVEHLRWPTLGIFMCIAYLITVANVSHDWSETVTDPIEHTVIIILIIFAGWFAFSMLTVVQHEVYRHNNVAVTDETDYHVRGLKTRVVVFKRIVGGLIILFVIAAVLLTFPQVREIGWGVLASAGVLSLLIGLAASPTIENLVASVQIALSQPIKIDDIVVINGEWGKVEEISSTYVVVLIWDQRRLIVPLSKIVKEPFQNWTRKSQDIIGTVFLYVDYTFPVNALREELKRVTESSPLWDKKVCVLHVTELKEQTMELRCLVSAKNAGNSFDLRCIVRESLIDFLQKNYPHCLPRTRMVYEGPRTPDKSKHPLMLSRLSEHSNVSG